MAAPLRSDSIGKLVLRLTLGLLLSFHGVSKLMHPAGAINYISGQLTSAGLPTFLAYGVFIGEVLAPIMIVLGIYSRIGGLIVVINMIFAVLLVHASQIFSLATTGGWTLELQAFYLFAGLALVFLGSGKIAVTPD
ncbi:MAG: DoxX family protein [Burkholderiales bacterium]|nr:DoxX family protein [Burkholderiales bacterium]